MRTKTLTLYKINELSENAKQKAIENYRNSNDEIFWQSELFDSLKAVFETANIELRDYSLGLNSYSYVKFDIDDQIAELSGIRAFTWLENNLFCKLRMTRNKYLKNRKDSFKYGYRIGKIPECPLTGYCADMDFLDSLKSNALKNWTLKDCFSGLSDVYVSLLQSEYDYQNSEEYIIEHLEANEYEFLEDGSCA